jgi:hypothetical protein
MIAGYGPRVSASARIGRRILSLLVKVNWIDALHAIDWVRSMDKLKKVLPCARWKKSSVL